MQAKNPGTQTALGLQGNDKLAITPNCFSTSGNEVHLLKPWEPKNGSNAMDELLETIKKWQQRNGRTPGNHQGVPTRPI